MNPQQEYWSNPRDKPNKPEAYAKRELNNRSHFLFKILEKYAHRKNHILELGCNVGRNLNYLHEKGFLNLHGIELNAHAVELMKKTYPKMYENSNISVNSIEGTVPFLKDNSFKIVISFAVLMHLPFESDFVMKEIARITENYLITVEDERQLILGDRHFPRDYKRVFEYLGMREVDSGKCPVKDLESYTWRIFKKC